MASVEDRAAELALFLGRYREGPHPILWVGAGASAAAGYPTLAGLETVLRRELPGVDKTGYEHRLHQLVYRGDGERHLRCQPQPRPLSL